MLPTQRKGIVIELADAKLWLYLLCKRATPNARPFDLLREEAAAQMIFEFLGAAGGWGHWVMR